MFLKPGAESPAASTDGRYCWIRICRPFRGNGGRMFGLESRQPVLGSDPARAPSRPASMRTSASWLPPPQPSAPRIFFTATPFPRMSGKVWHGQCAKHGRAESRLAPCRAVVFSDHKSHHAHESLWIHPNRCPLPPCADRARRTCSQPVARMDRRNRFCPHLPCHGSRRDADADPLRSR